MDDNIFNFDDDDSWGDLINSSILDFPDVNQFFADAPIQISTATSHSDNIEPNVNHKKDFVDSIFEPCCPFMDTFVEEHQYFEIDVGQFLDGLDESSPQISNKEHEQLEQIVAQTTSTKDMVENGDKAYNECTPSQMAQLFEHEPLHPQQNLMETNYNNKVQIPPSINQNSVESIYDNKEKILPQTSSATVTRNLNMFARIGGLYQDKMSALLGCNGGQEHDFFQSDIVPMSMSKLMTLPPPNMDYHNKRIKLSNLQHSSQQHEFGSPITAQNELSGYSHLQQQQLPNNSLVVGSNDTTPTVPVNGSTFEIGCITEEERKEKIKRYLYKRNQRNFCKKIKYECRKTLADNRPRVRGRFAKCQELGEMATTSTINRDFMNDEVVVKDGDFHDFSESFGDILKDQDFISDVLWNDDWTP